MKKECGVVRDLMPLVLDGVSSEESRELMLSHAMGCAECAAVFDQLKKDVPAKTAAEIEDEREAFARAAQKLRKRKRLRTLLHVLLGCLLACAVLLGGALAYRRLSLVIRPIGLDEYGIALSRLQDGRVIVSADYRGSTARLLTTLRREEETDAATGETVAVLYAGMKKHLLGRGMLTPMQNGPTVRISAEEFSDYGEIRRGTREDYVTLWRAGETIPAASPEMEAYYGWIEDMDRFEERRVELSGGEIGFLSAQDAERDSLMHTHWIALQAAVPEWQPWVGPQVKLLDEATLRWLLGGDEAQIPE